MDKSNVTIPNIIKSDTTLKDDKDVKFDDKERAYPKTTFSFFPYLQ